MIKPLPGYVLIEPIEDELKAGEVYLPEKSKDKPSKGKVVAVSDETLYIPNSTKKPIKHLIYEPLLNKTVIYKKWTNQEVEHEGKKYLLAKFDELLGVIE